MCKTLHEVLEYNEEQRETEMITQTDVKLQPRMKERSVEQGTFMREPTSSERLKKLLPGSVWPGFYLKDQ